MKKFSQINRTIKEETDTTEKVEMTQSQLHFIHYACEEILEFIDDGGEVEEWYQVKVAKAFSEFESLHSYMEGEARRTGMKEEVSKTADAPKMVRDRKTGEMYDPNKKFKELMDKPETKAVMNRLAKEDVEQIDEVRLGGLGKPKNIVHVDPKDGIKKTYMSGVKASTGVQMSRQAADTSNRLAIKRDLPDVNKKLGLNLKREEVEQIDELSKKTLGNYIKSATHDVAAKGAATRQFAIDSSRQSGEQDYDAARKSMAKSDKTFSKSWKRRDNMAKAVDRLAKEDVSIENATNAGRSLKEKPNKEPMPKMKTPLAESRKAEIVKEIVKKKKNEINLSKGEKFQPEPVLTSQIVKEDK
jgi:hypothetical protein